MPDVKIPFGFETQVSTDTASDNWRDIKGYQAQVTLNGIVVFERYYRPRDKQHLVYVAKNGRISVSGTPEADRYHRDLQQFLKNTANDDQDAAEQVLTAFAHRLALTLTWPDGA